MSETYRASFIYQPPLVLTRMMTGGIKEFSDGENQIQPIAACILFVNGVMAILLFRGHTVLLYKLGLTV